MTLVPMRALLDAAAEGGYGVGAFNVFDLGQAHAVLEAARATRSPVIIAALAGGSPYPSDAAFRAALVDAARRFPGPVALHLDHGRSLDACAAAIEDGFTSVMMDGSVGADGAPASFEDNVAVTREAVAFAHARGVTVEGEVGTIGRDTGDVEGGAAEIELTDPEEAEEFVLRTGVDALALAIGTAHGTLKFARPPDAETLRIDLVETIHNRLPDTHLVMHGSSTVLPELVDRINRNGGALRASWGVPIEEIRRGIAHGIRKINIGTDAQLGYTGALREALAAAPAAVNPRDYLAAAAAGMQAVVQEKMRAFGQAGRAAG